VKDIAWGLIFFGTLRHIVWYTCGNNSDQRGSPVIYRDDWEKFLNVNELVLDYTASWVSLWVVHIQYTPHDYLKIHFKIIFPSTSMSRRWDISIKHFRQKYCTHFPPLPCLPHALPIPPSLILSTSYYLEKDTHYEISSLRNSSIPLFMSFPKATFCAQRPVYGRLLYPFGMKLNSTILYNSVSTLQ
jgi:hypothetical protein